MIEHLHPHSRILGGAATRREGFPDLHLALLRRTREGRRSSGRHVSMTPSARRGDPCAPPPQEDDPLVSVEQLAMQSLFDEIHGVRRGAPGRVRPDQVAVHIERDRNDRRPFDRAMRFVLDLDPPEHDRRRGSPDRGTDLPLRVRDDGVVDAGSDADDLEINVRPDPVARALEDPPLLLLLAPHSVSRAGSGSQGAIAHPTRADGPSRARRPGTSREASGGGATICAMVRTLGGWCSEREAS